MNIFALWGEIEINRRQAETDIKSVEKQADKSGRQMESSFDRVTKQIDGMIKKADEFGKGVETLGKNITKKAGVPLAALTALMGGLAKTTADYGDRVAKQAQQIGLSVQSYQELEYAMGQNGVSTQEFEMSIGNLNQRIGMARRGNEQYRKTLEKLGFNLDELDKGAISTEESFNQIVAALADMDDGQMQAAIASDFFGTRVARRLIPAIRGGAEGIEELRQRAHDLGLVMDEEFTKRSELFGDTMDDLSRASGGLGRAVGKELLAPLINMGKWVTDIVSGVTGWIKENPKLVRQIIIWGGAIAGVLGVLVTLGTTLVITGKIIGALGAVFNILTSKPLLIIAAIGALYLAWESDWLNIRTTTETVVAAILAAWDSLTNWWEDDPLVQSVKQAWADVVETWEGLTLPEKALGVVSVAATITWALTFLQSFLAALLPKAGITAASGVLAGGAKFLFTLGALVVTAKIIWDLLPEGLQGDVKDLWIKVGEEIEKFNTETLNNPFIAGIATWLQNLDEEGWEIPTLTVTVLFMAFKLFQKGLALAVVLGKAIGTALGTVAVPLLGVMVAITGLGLVSLSAEERERLEERIAEIWEDENFTLVVRVSKIAIVLLEGAMAGFRNQYLNIVESLLGEDVRKEMEETESAMEEYHRYLQAYQKEHGWFAKVFKAPNAQKFMGDPDKYWAELTGEVAELTGELTKLEKQALIVAEVMKQGGTVEQAMAILGIGYWETRGHGGYTHTDPATGDVMRGGAGEYGIGQVMPGTGQDVWTRLWKQPAETYDEEILKDLDTNIAMMVSYFLDRYNVHGEDLRLAIEGYNRGTAIDGLQAYTVGVVDWMEGAEGQGLAGALYDGMTNALEAWVQAGYDMDGDVRDMAAFIAQILADHLIGQSPPPEEPLSEIEKGMYNTMESGIDGAEAAIEDGVPRVKTALEKIKDLFGTIWDKVPEDIREPIEQAIDWVTDLVKEAEEALFKLDNFQDELDALMGGGTDAESEAGGFMSRLAAGLNEKLDELDEPMNKLVNAVSSSAGTLMDVAKAVASGNWLDAFLAILMETESFAKAMELLGAVLDPVIALFDAVLAPIINFLLKLWNGIIDALSKISIFGWKPFGGLADKKIGLVGEGDGSGGGSGGSSGGRQVSEITGPTRDLLTDLMAPLANFGQIVAPIQDIRNILYERLPNFGNMDFAGAGVGAMGPAVVIENLNVTAPTTGVDDISRATIDQIEKALAGRIAFGQRGRGGR